MAAEAGGKHLPADTRSQEESVEGANFEFHSTVISRISAPVWDSVGREGTIAGSWHQKPEPFVSALLIEAGVPTRVVIKDTP